LFFENCTEEEKVFPLRRDFEKRTLTSAIRIQNASFEKAIG
jgi:hypothetical protein